MRSLDILVYVSTYLMIYTSYGLANDEAKLNKKIVIIGAGPAGIAAASKLFQNGFKNVTILEAENRIGGRLYTIKLGNYFVDLGGQWVHGQKDNVAFNLAYPLGLLGTENETTYNGKIFDSSGKIIDSSISENIETFANKYYIHGGARNQNTSSATSYGEFIKQTYEKEFNNRTEMMNHKAKILHFLEVLELSYDSGDSWNEVSVIDTDGYTMLEGDQDVPWKTRGYGTILDILMKRYPDPEKELPIMNNTILNSEVTLIDYNDSDKGHPIVITTKDNRKFEADHVIVTVSLGVLKAQYKSLFNPPLPAKKVEAIEILGFGSAGKVYFLYDEPFWNDEKSKTHFVFLWNDADRKAFADNPEKMWQLGLTGAWPVENKPKLLEFYIASKWAKAMEKIPENKVYNQTLELLQRFLGKAYNVTKPIAMIRTQWYTNPHFRGTYSYRSVESEERHVHPRMLQESITLGNPKILFAGEATSPHRFSTADGAIESGWTAAEALIKLYT